ncbi:MAG: hypothetical protein N3B16_10715 [Candidatus Aminicenantes bacterium]|nr:hypothetical protein [Candidatus Aminicenantes bacterium]
MKGTSSFFGYMGRWAFIDLNTGQVTWQEADPEVCRLFIGGRGLQAFLIYQHLQKTGWLKNPLSPENRLVIGNSSLNDTSLPTAGRGSCSFISPLTFSPLAQAWLGNCPPIYGLITHSSCGGHFHNRLKRAGVDQIIIDGRADKPVRILVQEEKIEIIEAEEELFEKKNAQKVLRPTSQIIDYLTKKYPGSSTLTTGPTGWNQVAFANLTADYHRNFGRGGAGAVFGSKNLVAITASGQKKINFKDETRFKEAVRKIDEAIKAHVADPNWTVSFRPETGTTWWLDRAFRGGYLGKVGGYLPWHNFDEGYFDPQLYEKVSTRAFLEIAGKHNVCSRCRHILCTRTASVKEGPYAHEGIRPEFETIALWINCCLTDREGIFYLNHLCNDFGVDTMTFGSLMAAVMELNEKGLWPFPNGPIFGEVESMIKALKEITYRSSDLGQLLAQSTDQIIADLIAAFNLSPAELVYCFTTAYAGLGYAGIEPKVFPGMFTAYGTSNRGRGDHTYAWTIQAEEAGLSGAEDIAAYVINSQINKALTDSLGLCDFFPEDYFSSDFLEAYEALTGFSYSPESFRECGRRIYVLERWINQHQGRTRAYDAFIPPKFLKPLTSGPQAGQAVDPIYYKAILDAYYALQEWTVDGHIPESLLEKLKIK